MGKLLPLSIFPPGQIMTPAEMPIQDYETDGKLFSLVSIRAAENGRAYVIQVAQNRSVDEQFEREFGLLVAVVLGCGIFASAIIAITVTRRGLRPLNDMTGSLRRVGPNRLHERVPPAEWPRLGGTASRSSPPTLLKLRCPETATAGGETTSAYGGGIWRPPMSSSLMP